VLFYFPNSDIESGGKETVRRMEKEGKPPPTQPEGGSGGRLITRGGKEGRPLNLSRSSGFFGKISAAELIGRELTDEQLHKIITEQFERKLTRPDFVDIKLRLVRYGICNPLTTTPN